MLSNFSKISNYTKIVYALLVALLAMVVAAILFFDVQKIEIVELIAVFSFFIVFLVFNKIKDKMMLWAFILFLIIDVLGVFNETNLFDKIIPTIKIIIYLIFALRIFRKFKLVKRNKYVLLFFSVVITLNVLLMYSVILKFSSSLLPDNTRLLFFFYGLILITMGVITMNYNFRYNSNRSFFFTCFVFASIISDSSWFIASFLDSKISYYVDSIFYIIALLFMVRYAVESRKEEDVILVLDEED